MIVAERKSIPELIDILRGHQRVLVLGCGTCVTVCLSGGEREVCIIASALRMARRLQGFALQVDELTIERQCDKLKKIAPPKDWSTSLAGGCRGFVREDHRI